MKSVFLKKNLRPDWIRLLLPASKSESNRALILEALAGEKGTIRNLSTARDTVTLNRLLKSREKILDVMDAGTTMRFLTAYLAVTGEDRIITGTPRMCERPIGILVDALREVGAEIDHTGKEGFPPLHIRGFHSGGKNEISMRGDVSSQFISAMIMIAAALENGLTIHLTGKIGSRPYIDMTIGLLRHYGVEARWLGNTIHIPHQEYRIKPYTVDPDWSGASYWFSMVALAAEGGLTLDAFRPDSLQGDRVIAKYMEELGVETTYHVNGIQLDKRSGLQEIRLDFTDCPDLAQTVIVACAAKGLRGKFSGLESLKIKETDRIVALQQEMSKIGARLAPAGEGAWDLFPADPDQLPGHVEIETYEDHRMAMAFAPLATVMDLTIRDPEVVNKSYPGFWDDMGKMFELSFDP